MRACVKRVAAIAVLVFLAAVLSGCSMFVVPRYVVNFYDGKDGNLIKTKVVRSAISVEFPLIEPQTGYELVGYKNAEDDSFVYYAGADDDEQPSFELGEKNDFYAVFEIKRYSITYELNGGTFDVKRTEYTVEEEFAIGEPKKDGFVFVGWRSRLNEKSPITGVFIPKGSTGDITFTAEWAKDDLYYLNFNADGGSGVDGASCSTGVFASASDSQRNGYNFLGWYDGDDKVTFPFNATKKVTTLKAKWSTITYEITCPIDENFKTIKYTVEDEVVVPNVEREGYTFLGYSLSEEEKPTKPFVVKKGTYGDLVLIPKYVINKYKISFVTGCDYVVADADYDFNTQTAPPAPPEREYCEFVGWYEDEDLTIPHVFGKMPAKDIVLYAKWHSDLQFEFFYSVQNASANVECEIKSGAKAVYEDRISLSVPALADGGVFDCWLLDGEEYCFEPSFTFVMPNRAVELVARYVSVETLSFVRSNSDELVLPFKNVNFISGEGISADDYSLGASASVKASFLSSLSNGVHAFYYTTDSAKGGYFLVNVTSSTTVSELTVDYDYAYPDVRISFSGKRGAEYEYSLDGQTYESLDGEVIIKSIYYDKSRSHSVTVRRKDDHSDSATVVKEAMVSAVSSYYQKSFSYGGQKYDYALENEAQLRTAIEYLCFVVAPTDPDTSTALEFALLGEVAASADELVPFTMNSIGAPYVPTYRYTLRQRSGAKSIEIIIIKRDARLNSVRSAQELAAANDGQKLLSASSRKFDSVFKIDGFEKTQKIRSIYELENLPYGVKPIELTADAAEVYSAAKDILRGIVDDDMNDFQKVTAIYDWIALNVTYDYVVAGAAGDTSIYRSFTTAGAILDKVAVCDGIAGAFKLMCLIEGIEAEEVCGLGNGGGHAWNKVKINGLWYGVDATWSRLSLGTEGNYYVTHAYVFMDEVGLNQTAHVENGNAANAAYVGRTEQTALNVKDYYDLDVSGGVRGIENKNDLTLILNASKKRGATALEFKATASADTVKSWLRAYFGLKTYTLYTVQTNVYFVLFV